MAAKYKKIDPRMWKDDRFRSLGDVEKLIAIYALTAQSNRIGFFNFSTALAAEDLGMVHERFLEGFDRVVSSLKWAWDRSKRVLFLPTWWKYNHPDGINVLIGNMSDMHDLPENDFTQQFKDNLEYLSKPLHSMFSRLCKQGGKVTGRMAHQEQEQEQEGRPPKKRSPAKRKTKKQVYDEVMNRMNQGRSEP